MPALVAIVTRTKDRPLLLKRAAKSVADQNYSNYVWIVVNDGGDEAEVLSVIENCNVDRNRVRLISHSKSVGMEAASNIGISQSDSDYIVIHDDDDTLHPDFLTETVGFLESVDGKRFGGVATRVEYVSEEISGDKVIIHDRFPYLEWVRSIEFAELLRQNTITTISFLYRRELFDEIGGYAEDFPVLGDWYFNIEFVLRADVKVLDRTLAYYHHRDRDSLAGGVQYSNSVVRGHDKHLEFASTLRNKLIRKHLPDSSISAAVVMGYFAGEMRNVTSRRETESLSARVNGRAVQAAFLEQDRLWVLSLVLYCKTSHSLLSFRKLPDIDLSMPLVELARIAKKFQIAMPPPESFDEAEYLRANPDVANEVDEGSINSGYEHYALNGHLEGRARPTVAPV